MADKDYADYTLTPDGLVKETSARNFPQASPAPGDQPWEKSDPEWYKSAVFYEVLVRAFYDSNGDGTGDLKGLTEKLEYLSLIHI